jgi:hypothetical protein
MGASMTYSRKTISNESDRVILEQGEARILFRTWKTTQERVLTRERIEYLEKRYGSGCVQRIRNYMDMMRKGELL